MARNVLHQKIKEQNELNLLLTESEEKYHSLFDDAINMIHIINPEGYLIDVNKSQIEKLGYSKKEMIGKFILEIISPKRIEKDKLFIKESLRNKKIIQKYETVVISKGGEEFIVELNATPQIVKGKIVAWRGILTDITVRKQAEEKIRENEQRLLLHIEKTPMAVIDWDTNFNVKAWNPAAEKIFGYTKEQALGKHAKDLIIPESAKAQVDVVWAELLAKKGGTRSINENNTKDGQNITCDWYNTPLVDEKGQVFGVTSLVDDITNRIEAENRIRQSEEQVRLLLDSTAEAIYGLDLKGNCNLVNQACLDFLGYKSTEDLLGKNMHSLMHHTYPDGSPFHQKDCQIYQSFIQGEQIHVNDEVLWRADGTSFPAEYWSFPIFREDHIIGSVVTFLDITKKKKAEEALRSSEEKYRLLFENMMNGFALHEIILNKKGVPVDYKFLEVNSAFEHLTGLKSKNIIGKKVTEVMPGIEKDPADWIGKYGKVALTCQEIRMEQYAQPLNRWYSVLAFCPRKGQFATIFEDITERKIAEQKLKDSEEQVRLLLDSTAEAIYGLDLKGNCTFVNQACLNYLGYKSTIDLLCKNMHSLIHHSYPDGSPYHEKECNIHQAFIKGKGIHVDEEVLWRSDGTSFPAEYWSFPIFQEGHVIGSVVTFLDITDRKQIEDALNDSEEKHRNLVETSQDLIFKSDSAGRFTYLNPAWEKTLGYKEDEMLGRVFSEFKPPEQATKGLNKFKSILAGQNTFGHEAIYLSKSGEDVHLVFNVQILKDSSGKVIGTQGTAHNITKRKLAEEKLKNTLIELEQLKNRLQEENIYLQEEIKLEHNFEKIIGRSESLKKVLQDVEQIAPTDSPVLILGETGTGKELIARAIHNLSIRKDRPLVKVNCGALPPNLIESELFGHEKGAFTGATGLRKGRFELADGGTIFLDEISEIPIELQVKLLRVLQESEFERVGGDRTLKVNVRIISATNRELEKSIRENKFRQDLYYRINVLSVHVPPLRERKEDIPLLTNFFVKKYSKKLGKKIERISKKTMDFLQKLSWPGNIRELENIIERAVIFSKEGILQIDESAFLKPEKIIQQQNLVPMEEMEREHIRRILESTNWIIAGACGAASILNLNSSTLRSRMKKLGIKNPKRA